MYASWSLLGPSWEALGTSWEPLGASWGHLGTILDPSWNVFEHLGASWAHLGNILGPLGAILGANLLHDTLYVQKPIKTIGFSTFLAILLEPLGPILGASWSILGPSWEHLEPILGASWCFLRPSWEPTCFMIPSMYASWAHLGNLLGHLGPILGASWSLLGSSSVFKSAQEATTPAMVEFLRFFLGSKTSKRRGRSFKNGKIFKTRKKLRAPGIGPRTFPPQPPPVAAPKGQRLDINYKLKD